MKLFGKELTGKEKREMITRIILIILSGAVLIVSAVTTAAWFSSNTTVRNTGMQVVVKTKTYELLVKRTNEFDRVVNAAVIYPGVAQFKTVLGEDGYDVSNTSLISSNDSPMIGFELVNEYPLTQNGITTYYLRPGSYGTLTFYVKLLSNEHVNLDFSLSIGGFANGFDNEDHAIITKVNNQTYLNYLKGHLLFFTGRTGAAYENYKYTDLIDTGTFSYGTSGKAALTDQELTEKLGIVNPAVSEYHGCCYEVTLYWEWPLTYSDILDDTSTVLLQKRYPQDIEDYIEANQSFFFADGYTTTGNTIEELNNGYNDADQFIGDNIHYVVAYIDND